MTPDKRIDDAAVSIFSLTKRYGEIAAVSDLDLVIKKGEIFGFLGHNGAGKTTTVNMLTTLLAPTCGTARVAGYDVSHQGSEVRKRIGYLPENVQFYANLTARENLMYFAKLSGIGRPEARIEEVLDYLNASDYQNKKMGACSKGMKQRVGIAQAILHKPEVLFLDEPTSGLDPTGVKQLREIILKLNSEMGMTIFMNTHLLSEVAKTCSIIGILSRGRLIYNDSLDETLKRFKDENSLEDIYLSIQEKG